MSKIWTLFVSHQPVNSKISGPVRTEGSLTRYSGIGTSFFSNSSRSSLIDPSPKEITPNLSPSWTLFPVQSQCLSRSTKSRMISQISWWTLGSILFSAPTRMYLLLIHGKTFNVSGFPFCHPFKLCFFLFRKSQELKDVWHERTICANKSPASKTWHEWVV